MNSTMNSTTAVAESVVELENSLDDGFLIISGAFVFLMQLGFATLTAGTVRRTGFKSSLFKNVFDACVGALAYYLFGYGIYSDGANPVFGTKYYALIGDNVNLIDWFYSWTFAATATTIVSGSVAERATFQVYLIYAFILTGFVYPVVAHTVWNGGFLATQTFPTMLDFAGSSVVHVVGGFAGLVGAHIIEPRPNRFGPSGENQLQENDVTLCAIGTFVLWFGWYGFNVGSVGRISKFRITAGRCAVNTTLSGAMGGFATLVYRNIILKDRKINFLSVLNGILAGLVAITAGCATVEPYISLIIGSVGGLVYLLASNLLIRARIDDPLDAFSVHGASGAWGTIAVGLFSRRDLQVEAGISGDFGGLFYGGDNFWKLFVSNCIGLIIIIVWTCSIMFVFFKIALKIDFLKVPNENIDDEQFISPPKISSF